MKDHQWHVALNRFNFPHADEPELDGGHRDWMYEAKAAFFEVPRMARLHAAERLAHLPVVHQQCSMSPTEPVSDNHLTCCLGIECRKCPELKALELAEMPSEDIDTAKAWTCATHIISRGGDQAKEGYLLTVDDAMFWQNTYASLASNPDDEGAP